MKNGRIETKNKIKKDEFKISIRSFTEHLRVYVSDSEGNANFHDTPNGTTLHNITEGQLLDAINGAKDRIEDDRKERAALSKVESAAYRIANPRK